MSTGQKYFANLYTKESTGVDLICFYQLNCTFLNRKIISQIFIQSTVFLNVFKHFCSKSLKCAGMSQKRQEKKRENCAEKELHSKLSEESFLPLMSTGCCCAVFLLHHLLLF